MVTLTALPHFSPPCWKLLRVDKRGDGSIHTLSHIDRLFINFPKAELHNFRCHTQWLEHPFIGDQDEEHLNMLRTCCVVLSVQRNRVPCAHKLLDFHHHALLSCLGPVARSIDSPISELRIIKSLPPNHIRRKILCWNRMCIKLKRTCTFQGVLQANKLGLRKKSLLTLKRKRTGF